MSDGANEGLRLLLVALSGAVLFHGGLLPFTHANTYDAFIHMFFGDSYYRSWFDTWEPRWYTGFATTSYPPGTHMAIAAAMHLLPLRAAFVVVQLAGLLLLVVGTYRFSLLWVQPKAAGYAAIALVLSSSVTETIHLFGQLPTIFSLGVFLNGLPYVYRWIVIGRSSNLLAAVVFASATTAAHHVTTIFGGILFILPLGFLALRAFAELHPSASRRKALVALWKPLLRGMLLAALMIVAVVITVLPYWIWSIDDPITQVPIPHGSRESFIENPNLGLIFFLLPWGLAILFLPYVIYKTATTRLWPLGLSVLVCFILGTGGTTPISRAILRGAFDILTLDRFTFWATILVLPFVGYAVDEMLSGRLGLVVRDTLGRGAHRLIAGSLFLSMTLLAVFTAILPVIQPTQPKFISPAPIVQFLSEDDHNRWRYLTLGFGDQFAYLSAQTDALSVDGNYHSARRLPDLTRFSVERLENAKYLGVPGLGSLRQFLVNAETYNLKYVFSNDDFYDPLLFYSGWSRLTRLSNGVTVWEKPDVPPLPSILPRRNLPPLQTVMWGLLPPISLVLSFTIFLGAAIRRNFGHHNSEVRPLLTRQIAYRNPHIVRMIVLAGFAVAGLLAVLAGSVVWVKASRSPEPEALIASYFDDLDFRRFRQAYASLDPVTRRSFEDVMFNWKWRGGLVASYGKLIGVRTHPNMQTASLIDWEVDLEWLTAVKIVSERVQIRTIRRDGRWYIAPQELRQIQVPARILTDLGVAWNVSGRRQPRIETDLHKDIIDRPAVAVFDARLVKRTGRYFIVGGVSNIDAVPAHLSVLGGLRHQGDTIVRQAGGEKIPHRLIALETAGFQVDFEGILSLTDGLEQHEFDPTVMIPPELPHTPEGANLDIRAVASGRDFYPDIALNGVRAIQVEEGVLVTGLAVNTGLETASVVQVSITLLDETGRPVWVETGYVEANIYPGQSDRFQILLPSRGEIEIVSETELGEISINGSNAQDEEALRRRYSFEIKLPAKTGYRSAAFHISSMTYDPLF